MTITRGKLFLLAMVLIASSYADIKTANKKEFYLSDVASEKQQESKPKAELSQDPQVKALTMDIWQGLMKKNNGNIEKIMQIIQKAQSNPEAFAEQFTPDQLRELSNIAKQMEKQMNEGR